MAARRIKAYFDGVCEPVNPGGHGAWGAITRIDGSTTWQEGGYVGQGNHISNNVAEYAAVAEILKRTRDLEGEITIYGDSKLVIYQLRGEWRVKKGLYVPY